MKNIYLVTLLTISLSLISCQKKFNKEVWLKPKNNNFLNTKNPRAYMIKDLLNKHLHVNMAKEDIIKILGKPYKDTIRAFLPKDILTPDSLKIKSIYERPENEREKYLKLSKKWRKKNYKSFSFLSYLIGWSLMDPNFLIIRLNNENKIVDYWIEQH